MSEKKSATFVLCVTQEEIFSLIPLRDHPSNSVCSVINTLLKVYNSQISIESILYEIKKDHCNFIVCLITPFSHHSQEVML